MGIVISALYEAGVTERDIQYAAGQYATSITRHYTMSKASDPSLDMIEHAAG